MWALLWLLTGCSPLASEPQAALPAAQDQSTQLTRRYVRLAVMGPSEGAPEWLRLSERDLTRETNAGTNQPQRGLAQDRIVLLRGPARIAMQQLLDLAEVRGHFVAIDGDATIGPDAFELQGHNLVDPGPGVDEMLRLPRGTDRFAARYDGTILQLAADGRVRRYRREPEPLERIEGRYVHDDLARAGVLTLYAGGSYSPMGFEPGGTAHASLGKAGLVLTLTGGVLAGEYLARARGELFELRGPRPDVIRHLRRSRKGVEAVLGHWRADKPSAAEPIVELELAQHYKDARGASDAIQTYRLLGSGGSELTGRLAAEWVQTDQDPELVLHLLDDFGDDRAKYRAKPLFSGMLWLRHGTSDGIVLDRQDTAPFP
jgi:hypothetical protein